MKKKLPVLIIIPHGGTAIPEELEGNEALDRFDIFFESDACAHELFAFEDTASAVIGTSISRLFVDVDRPPMSVTSREPDGVIKRETLLGKPVFKEKTFPDEIAIANILKRYYFPFHQTIERIMETNEIKLVIDCHTMMAVGPRSAHDPGKPRPLITLCNLAEKDGGSVKSCPDELCAGLLEGIKKFFGSEDSTVAGRFAINTPFFKSHILEKNAPAAMPMLRLSLSRALFLNEKYFNHKYLRVDELRMRELREKLWSGIERFFKRYF